ncbi:MAG: type II secretion system protein N [Gammaproteobacteria bacterium]|nr:type II secretion system protein N [Gammaproteobacteria bacterium]
MQRAWRLLALGVAAYLLILTTTFPAARVTGMLEERVSDLSIHAVSGSVFSGQAGQVTWQDLDLGAVHWQFRPMALLLGSIEYLLELTHPANHGRLIAGVSLTGRVYAQDLELAVLPDRVLNHYSPVAVTTSGELLLAFEEIDLADMFSNTTTGQLAWRDAVIFEPVDMVLGQLELGVRGTAEELVGEVIEGGELGASGEVSLSRDNRYLIRLLLQPGNDVSADTLDMLEAAAQMQPNGDYLIEQSGQL